VVALISVSGLALAEEALLGDPNASYESTDSPSTGTDGKADSGGGGGNVNNEVVIVNQTDGRSAERAGFGFARVTGGDVTNTNSAAAVASCADCRTIAVAVQAVLVMGDSDNIAPVNQAVAINTGCTRCDTYALAYQYVVSTDGIVRFTSAGQQRLAALRAQVSDLVSSELGFLEMEVEIDALVEQMWQVVDEETVAVGGGGTPSKSRDVAEDGAASSPSPAVTASP
jgi:putative peptide zinc metalloprotease protein